MPVGHRYYDAAPPPASYGAAELGADSQVDINGEHRFNAPPGVVWAKLLDPAALRASMPGCERFDEVGPDSYDVVVKVGISAIKGTYQGNVKVQDVQPQTSYRLAVSGSGKPGSVQGGANMVLAADGAGTLVKYTGDVKAQGAIARLGSRLLGGAAKLMIGQFFKAMEKQLEQPAAGGQASPV
jgi:carbon monoxide dehydrogenase subunit G